MALYDSSKLNARLHSFTNLAIELGHRRIVVACVMVEIMTTTTLSLSRRHVLGDIHFRCDDVSGSIPVYLEGDEDPVLIGYADQSLGHYSDAISFHLDSDECKKLSTGNFSFSGTYEFSNPRETNDRSRVKITSITLTGRKSYEKPVPKQKIGSEPG